MSRMSHEQWTAKAIELFGEEPMDWAFVCPSCGFVATLRDWKEAGASSSHAGFSCVGRWMDAPDKNTFSKNGGPCQYSGGGLITLNPVTVETDSGPIIRVFDFAPRREELIPEERNRS